MSVPQQTAIRAIEGPTEQKFQHTGSRLNALESSLQELRQAQAEQAASQQVFQNTTQQNMKASEEGLKTFVANSVAAVRQEVDKSVRQAMEIQTANINANLVELKRMFQAQAKRTRTKNEDEDMEDES